MSMMQDPKKIADWLIKRAGSSPAARLYIAAISKAKGLLLAPGEQGTTAVSVVADMKAQGVTVREAEAAGTAGAAAPAGAAAKPAVPVVKHGAPGAAAAAAAAAAVVAGLNKPAPAAGEGVAPAGAAGEGVAPAPEAPAGEAAEPAADVDDGANLGSGRRSRKTRHRTPKRKKLSRKKSVKRK